MQVSVRDNQIDKRARVRQLGQNASPPVDDVTLAVTYKLRWLVRLIP